MKSVTYNELIEFICFLFFKNVQLISWQVQLAKISQH